MSISTAKVLKRRRVFRFPRTRWGMFLAGFFKHPVMVGALMQSSKVLIRRMLAPVDWATTKVFVEYGPGVGTFTQPILDRLSDDAVLIAIDTNPDFVAFLKETIVDPRLRVINGSAADVERFVSEAGFDHADYVASGIPFSTLPPGIGDQVAAASRRVLRPGGGFLVYQYNPKVRNFIARQFERIDHVIEWRNLPPAQLWWAWKD